MSTVSAGFEPAEVVETIEAGRTYPKKAVISYLLGRAISDCFKEGSGELIECDELRVLVNHYGLLPLGPPKLVKFLGQHLIDAEVRRATDDRVESSHNRANAKSLQKVTNEGMGPAEGSRGKA